ncbi:uncharacterized protein V1518DRAFT_338822 [Limtongia smithiae]|uniref:uncharacterized protein n=1 Tax=Limtongia smithiae TaxID=1125753 RepID=UPI0034CDB8AB
MTEAYDPRLLALTRSPSVERLATPPAAGAGGANTGAATSTAAGTMDAAPSISPTLETGSPGISMIPSEMMLRWETAVPGVATIRSDVSAHAGVPVGEEVEGSNARVVARPGTRKFTSSASSSDVVTVVSSSSATLMAKTMLEQACPPQEELYSTALTSLPYEIQVMILYYADAIDPVRNKVGKNIRLNLVCQSWREIIQQYMFATLDIVASTSENSQVRSYKKKRYYGHGYGSFGTVHRITNGSNTTSTARRATTAEKSTRRGGDNGTASPNLTLAEVLFRTNPILTTYVRRINVVLTTVNTQTNITPVLAGYLDGSVSSTIQAKQSAGADIISLRNTMKRLWAFFAQVAQPSVGNTRTPVFAEHRTEPLQIVFRAVGAYGFDQVRPPKDLISVGKAFKFKRINAPVELKMCDTLIRGKYFHPQTMCGFVNSLPELQRLTMWYSFMNRCFEGYRQYYSNVLTSLMHLDLTKLTHLMIQFHYNSNEKYTKLMHDVYETPKYLGGEGDRMNRVIRQLARQLKSFKYVGPVTPELFGMLPDTAAAPEGDDREEYVQQENASVMFPDLERFIVLFHPHDSFGETYFDIASDVAMDDFGPMYLAPDEGWDSAASDEEDASYVFNYRRTTAGLWRRRQISWRNYEPSRFVVRREKMRRLSAAFTSMIVHKAPRLQTFSCKDLLQVVEFAFLVQNHMNQDQRAQRGCIPKRKMQDVRERQVVYTKHFGLGEEQIQQLRERFADDYGLAVIEDRIDVRG